jgi:hypothetical protein
VYPAKLDEGWLFTPLNPTLRVKQLHIRNVLDFIFKKMSKLPLLLFFNYYHHHITHFFSFFFIIFFHLALPAPPPYPQHHSTHLAFAFPLSMVSLHPAHMNNSPGTGNVRLITDLARRRRRRDCSESDFNKVGTGDGLATSPGCIN